MKIFGMILIGVGFIILLYSEFQYTTKEKIIDLGPIEIEKNKKHSVAWPPITGIALLLCGVIVIIVDKRK